MTPTPRAAYAVLAIAVLALGSSRVRLGDVGRTRGDRDRRRPRGRAPPAPRAPDGSAHALTRGRDELRVETDADTPGRVEIRQARPADVEIEPSAGRGTLTARVTAHRRGKAVLPPVTARCRGPLGLGRCTFTGEGEAPLLVYPDVVAAHRLVVALRRGQFRDPGLRARGPLGLGTDFESVRDYLPDDDVRQINWTASQRTGRPMSNVYRIEQDRDVVCLLDAGRLMAAPLDAAHHSPRRRGRRGDHGRSGRRRARRPVRRDRSSTARSGRSCGRVAAAAARSCAPILDAEPTGVDSDYDLAFRTVSGGKRALILVFTDLVDTAAARALVASVPVLTRRHAVIVASVRDPDLDSAQRRVPTTTRDVYAAAVAIDVLEERRRVAARLEHAGARVVDAPAAALGEACVRAYLRLKARARL